MARILIVDDANFMRVTLETIVKEDKHEVIGGAENGEEAIKLYKEMKPDLVTMDITMPVMNGIDAIKEIMEYDSEAKIVVCSAMGQQKVVVEAIEIGAKDFIVKPFDENRVLDTISRVLHEFEHIS
ncbi:two-component system, chemotaxis family, response regulator CheY [Virgibacillus subterraneus]|uniref:Two-component system, chemotaxis family, response regulator CheY n=2 Tax=Virgibacillus TaxID=84406 RepID=A0A1H1C2P2_9BACI|nr:MULTISPECIES: response regulator [Virgibacillus]SDQ58300.1 two-component system, chemotaxis family, response regulator CheY [Virgibacillus salinus]SEQ55336.1 two-component system, chemotaxis family, response regulator CheY [Virgibacillus subterraneus]